MTNIEYPENREWKQKAFGMPKLPSGDMGQDKVLYYILKMVKDGKSANTMLNIEGSNSTAKSKCNEANTIKILSKWYWCGILGEMYGGANETRYANDMEDVIDEVFQRPNPARTINSAFFSSTRLLTLQTRLSAAYKGVIALLYKEKCRDFMNDTTIDIVNSMLESPDIHHIFPEAYCVKMGIERKYYNSIVNKTPILPATNRSIGGRAPSEYTKNILKKVDGLTEDVLKERIESHCINYEALVSDDFHTYLIDRAKKILGLIEKAMGKPVSDRDADTTVEQFGEKLV